MASLERECHKVTEELQSHMLGIQDQLMKILQTNWATLLASQGPSQAAFDAKIESGKTVLANNYMLEILSNLQKMHKVLSVTMEVGQLEVIFKEAFRLLVVEIENFFSGINTDSKFAKVRAKVDLTQIQKVISGLQFETTDVSEMAEQKIRSLLNTKCGVVAKEQQPPAAIPNQPKPAAVEAPPEASQATAEPAPAQKPAAEPETVA